MELASGSCRVRGPEVCSGYFWRRALRRRNEEEARAGYKTDCLTCSPFKLEWMDDPWCDVRSRRWLLHLSECPTGADPPEYVRSRRAALALSVVSLSAHSCVPPGGPP